MTKSLLFPDKSALLNLKTTLCAALAKMPQVYRIMLFGSFAREDYDAWSDLDMLVVTAYQRDFWQVFLQLTHLKSVIHCSPFNPNVQPCGAFILGNVFADESVFHCVDLNFLSLAQLRQSDSLARFGLLQVVFNRDEAEIPLVEDRPTDPPPEHPDEKRIANAQHFTKKALKKYLRQRGTLDDVYHFANYLEAIMQDYPPDMMVSGGNIGYVAHQYLEMVAWLRKQ
jgi:predicted nucleotidyltransferase